MQTYHAPQVDLELWERFHAGAFSRQEIETSLVLTRWSRCRDSGLSADNPGVPLLALEKLPASLEHFSPLLAPGSPFDAFATTIAREGYCGLLCDREGLVLARHIAEPFAATVAETQLVEGSVWSEAARGTNGIGTTLAECRPVSVVGVEHYEHRNHGLACYAAPVRDVRARVVGVLDATGPNSQAGAFIHASVIATAAAVEALFVARTYDAALPGGLFELERLLERLPHASLLVESTGHVRRSNSQLRRLLQGAASSELLDAIRARLSKSPTGTIHRIEGALGPLKGLELELEPIGQASDPFAALVHLRPARRALRTDPRDSPLPAAFAAITGSDAAIEAARTRAARFAPTDLPLLLLGESGTGKELFARAVHAASRRSQAAFVALNAGTLTGSLLESELFGYAPGAFTGAAPGGRVGKLAAGHGGTLFLDEIGDLPLGVQAMLLRFLEDGSFFRLGESAEQRADVRLIAATSRDLPGLVSEGRFRSDLYFRLRGVVLRLPALRDRTDRRELAEGLLLRMSQRHGVAPALGLSPAALVWIESHAWPGNVRELRSALEYAAVLASEATRIELWHLPVDDSPEGASEGTTLERAERGALLSALDFSKGNLSNAARHLGVARSTLYRMMERQGLRTSSE